MSDGLLSDAAVKAIQDGVRTDTVDIGDKTFTTRRVFDPDADLYRPQDPVAKTLELSTLTGLVEFVEQFTENQDDLATLIHIESPTSVAVLSEMRDLAHDREVYARAKANPAPLGLEKFLDAEVFVIGIQTLCNPSSETERLLKLVGSIREEQVRTSQDDGVTQVVTAKSGIARVAEVPVGNPWILQPYRTFLEVAQPTSPFILRMRQGKAGEPPSCALFECDGGQWRLEAVKCVAAYLREKLEGIVVVA